jgi:acetylornithine deacetylase
VPSPFNIDAAIDALQHELFSLLREIIAIPSISGDESRVVELLARFASASGLAADMWCATDRELVDAFGALPAHKPFQSRPTLVLTLPGTIRGRSLIFNAHSDVVSPGNLAAWSCDPWNGGVRDGAILGRGACDDKGPLVAALWAMLALRDSAAPLSDIHFEIVPGEEDCVGLGTMTSILRGYRADAAIVLEPTQGVPRCASRGGLRFKITITGRAVHGTVKWLGVDAISIARDVMSTCDSMQNEWNDRGADPLFASFPFARPITIDHVAGGEWQGMVCDRCTIAGYLELLPGDDLDEWATRFRDEVVGRAGVGRTQPVDLQVDFPERYPGHRTSPDSEFARTISRTLASDPHAWSGFNSGCEAGVRAARHSTPTVVWGPGDLAQAHAPDERVSLSDVRRAARDFAVVASHWCSTKDSQ